MGKIARENAITYVATQTVRTVGRAAWRHDLQVLRTQADSHFTASVRWCLLNPYSLSIDFDYTEITFPAYDVGVQ